MVEWLSSPHRRPSARVRPPDPALHNLLVLFHLRKVVRLKILVEKEGGQRVDEGIHYPFKAGFH